MTTQPPTPETIERLGAAVFRSFAMRAGMELDLFTPLTEGPMNVVELAQALNVGSTKLEPLLYSLVDAGLLTVEGERFSNTPESDHFLVRGKPTYMGERHHQFPPSGMRPSRLQNPSGLGQPSPRWTTMTGLLSRKNRSIGVFTPVLSPLDAC